MCEFVNSRKLARDLMKRFGSQYELGLLEKSLGPQIGHVKRDSRNISIMGFEVTITMVRSMILAITWPWNFRKFLSIFHSFLSFCIPVALFSSLFGQYVHFASAFTLVCSNRHYASLSWSRGADHPVYEGHRSSISTEIQLIHFSFALHSIRHNVLLKSDRPSPVLLYIFELREHLSTSYATSQSQRCKKIMMKKEDLNMNYVQGSLRVTVSSSSTFRSSAIHLDPGFLCEVQAARLSIPKLDAEWETLPGTFAQKFWRTRQKDDLRIAYPNEAGDWLLSSYALRSGPDKLDAPSLNCRWTVCSECRPRFDGFRVLPSPLDQSSIDSMDRSEHSASSSHFCGNTFATRTQWKGLLGVRNKHQLDWTAPSNTNARTMKHNFIFPKHSFVDVLYFHSTQVESWVFRG